ncbi:feline leukemia virus subgroup C receptor-related protein 2-like isoform X2 [Haliotis rufescens]|uniref:feline leukemia virus subgroup C receptor-related protein 2-like isoform X2 n=1 Tax=Haliotis rufescens TaxID=6454 RepID=UPI00201F348C|nr:feline leukemia virus subgroup C receptor-related protein 2-like isoform X2 [Haliotis rufescens]
MSTDDAPQDKVLPQDAEKSGLLIQTDGSTKVYLRRWLMLTLFCAFSVTTAYQWIHLNIIANIVIRYYNSSLPGDSLQQEAAVDWLSLIYMLVYLPTIVPAMMLLNNKGLRVNNIVGSLLNTMGAWLKVGALGPERFPVLMTGQVLCAMAEVFVVSIPPRLAAVWFGPDQVSTATSLGVFGNQIGVAVGFLIPPILVNNSPNITDIGAGLTVMNYGTASVTTAIFLLMLVTKQSLKSHPAEPGYWLNTPAGTRTTGNLYTRSSQTSTSYFLLYPTGEEENTGRIGLTIVLAGIAGAIMAGLWLDKTKAFKWTSVGIYALSLVGMIAFTVIIECDLNRIWIIYLVAGFLGFFMTGYLPVGYEFAAEITYPASEATSSGILTSSAMFCGMILTLGMRAVMNRVSILAANITLCSVVCLGVILTAMVRPDYRRQAAETQVVEKLNHIELTIAPPANSTRETTLPGLAEPGPDEQFNKPLTQ